MSKPQYFRANPSFSASGAVNVDRENDVIKNTKIAMYGRNLNDSFFDNDFLNELVKQGNSNESGIKCRFGHPNMCANSFGTYVGRYRNHRVDNGVVFADLYLDPVQKKRKLKVREFPCMSTLWKWLKTILICLETRFVYLQTRSE